MPLVPPRQRRRRPVEDDVDNFYEEYVLTRPRPPQARLESVDELYEGYVLMREGSETRIGSIDTEFNQVEHDFFDRGERLVEDAARERKELERVIAELDRLAS